MTKLLALHRSRIAQFCLICCCWLAICNSLSAQDKRKSQIAQTEKEKKLTQLRADEKTERARLAEALRHRDNSTIVAAQQSLATLHQKLNNSDSAVIYLLQAIKVSEKISANKPLRANLFTQLAELFFNENLYKNAVVYYDSVLQIEPNNLKIREKMGDAYLLDGRLLPAERAYQPLIEKLTAAGNLRSVVEIYQKLAQTCNHLDVPKRGVDYYKLIQNIVEQIGSTEEKAQLYNNLGYQYYLSEDNELALKFLEKAKSLCQDSKCLQPEIHLINLGIVQHNLKDNQNGIVNLLAAIKILNKKKDYAALANVEQLTAKVYYGANDFYNALSHNNASIKYARETQQHNIWRDASKTAAEIYLELYDHENAIEYYRDYLHLDDSLRQVDQGRQRRQLNQQALLARTEKNTQLLIRENTIQELYQEQVRNEQEKLQLANAQLSLLARQKEDSLQILQSRQQLFDKEKLIAENEIKQKTLELLQINQKLQFEARQRAAERELSEIARQQELERAQQSAKDSLAARDIEQLRQAAEISDLRLQQQEAFKKFAYSAGAVGVLVLSLLGIGWFFARQASRRLRQQKNQIESERAKSDSLLRNILPDEVAGELKQNGFATPRQYEQVTVLFSDFVNFTKLSQNMSPAELIDELNECFLAFDLIADRHKLEKIKTIGDAFMCAGGVPLPNASNPTDAVAAAIEMFDWLRRRSAEKPSAVFREMRVGIHTGHVIAGVVGKNKFAYDIWGDAVNLAARLEEFGEAGQINISEATFHLVKNQFTCDYRGKKPVHNKGLVDMYFVRQATVG